MSVLFYLRFELGNYANIRPCKLYEGLDTPLKGKDKIDFVFVRENLEGLYSVIRLGEHKIEEFINKNIISIEDYEKYFNKGTGYAALKIITEENTEKIAKLACEYTVNRKKLGHHGKLTIVHKSNVMPLTDGTFKRVAYEIAKSYIEKYNIQVNDYYVDDMARRLVRFPEDQDVLLTVNEYGDILSDLGAELVGGLGLAPSACIGGRIPYFEPVHGSAPDIAGLGIANPMAAILSLKMLMEYFKFKEAGILEKAIEDYFKLLKNIKENWRFIPRDLVPKEYQESNKFGKTDDVTKKLIELIELI